MLQTLFQNDQHSIGSLSEPKPPTMPRARKHRSLQSYQHAELLAVIEEDENDGSRSSGQLKKQTAVQCLASLASAQNMAAQLSDDAMETEEVYTGNNSGGGVPPPPPPTEQEDDWGHFYADSSSDSLNPGGSHSDLKQMGFGSSSKRPPLGKQRRRRTAKYPRSGASRCSTSPAMLPPNNLCQT